MIASSSLHNMYQVGIVKHPEVYLAGVYALFCIIGVTSRSIPLINTTHNTQVAKEKNFGRQTSKIQSKVFTGIHEV